MSFKDQIVWTVFVGAGMFSLGVMFWLGSQAAAQPSDSWVITAAWALVVSGFYVFLTAIFRAVAREQRFRLGLIHPFATWTRYRRWYYWVDRNGKDRDA